MFSKVSLRFAFVSIAALTGFINYSAADTEGELRAFTAYLDGTKLLDL